MLIWPAPVSTLSTVDSAAVTVGSARATPTAPVVSAEPVAARQHGAAACVVELGGHPRDDGRAVARVDAR